MSKASFRISFSGSFELTTNEIWPDGDEPENPTVQDVRNWMMNSGGSKSALLRDWNLERDLDITIVDENGKTAEWSGP